MPSSVEFTAHTYQAVRAGVSVVTKSLPEACGVVGVLVHVMQHLQASLVHRSVVPVQPAPQLEAGNQQQQSQNTCIILPDLVKK